MPAHYGLVNFIFLTLVNLQYTMLQLLIVTVFLARILLDDLFCDSCAFLKS